MFSPRLCFTLLVLTATLVVHIILADGDCEMYTDRSDVVFDCINKSLKEIPNDVPINVTVLLLSDNQISSVDSISHLSNLKRLDISRNTIDHLASNSLSGLVALEELYLHDNNLHPNNVTYPKAVFEDIGCLRVLRVHRNYFTDDWSEYPDAVFGQLTSLVELQIDGLLSLKFGPGFKNLKHLTRLVMSGFSGFCNTTRLANDSFENLPENLQYLDASYCVEAHAFRPLTNLKYLDISFTNHLEFPGFLNVTYNIMFIPVVTLNLSRFHDLYTGYINLEPDLFRYLANSTIEKLVLEFNHIISIHPGTLKNFPHNLTYLSLRDNNINDGKWFSQFHLLHNVRYVDLSYQFHDRYQDGEKPLNIFLSRDTNITTYLKPYVFLLPPNLEYLHASHLKYRYPISSVIFPSNKIKFIDMSYNGFTSWIGTVYGLHELELLNFSNNGMVYLSPTAMGDMFNLKHLLLSGNRFGDSLYRDKQSLAFSNQTKLEIFDLSSNEIKTLHRYTFRSQVALQELMLNNNSLTGFDFAIGHMRSLKFLDLSFNQLSYLPAKARSELDNIVAQTGSHIRVSLRGNTLLCSCEQIEFLEWLQQTEIKIDYRTYTCQYKNSSIVSMAFARDLIESLKVECIAQQLVIGCVATFVALLLVLAIPVIIYYQRWKLRYLYHIGRRNTNPYQQLDIDVRPEFDVYVSFDHTSRDFVVNKLHNALILRGLKISVEEQLTSCGPMARCISDGIKNSSKVVALLTKQYFKDQWAAFAFHIAVQEGIYIRRQILIPVIMEDLDVRDIPEDIHLIMKSVNCLVFPRNGREELFWTLLEARIRE